MNKQFVRALCASTCFIAVSSAWTSASLAAAAAAVPTVANGIAGVVTGEKGPEAGVWVIAETSDFPTRLIKIVVTDDQGRYLIPELPAAKYEVWVRGYGLVDSPRVVGEPGKNMNLKATTAPTPQAAAQIYPANYWFSMIKIPDASEFPGTGPKGNGIAANIKTQQQWIQQTKSCVRCHQQGDRTTRTLLNNTPEGWAERITKARESGDQAVGNTGPEHAASMVNGMTQFGRTRGLAMWADWTQRIEKGEVPEAPPRPAGVERNIVLTSWDWGNGRYVHDLVSTDRLNPTNNPNGNIYGITAMHGYIEVLNPVTAEQSELAYRIEGTTGKVHLLDHPDPVRAGVPHNPMLDHNNRLWITDRGQRDRSEMAKGGTNREYCTDGNLSKFAKYWPQPGRGYFTSVQYDPQTKEIAGVPMCTALHHLMMTPDKKMYFSGGDIPGWVDVDVWDATKDPNKSQGWCPMVLDTNSKTPSRVGALNEVVITPDREQWNKPARAANADPEASSLVTDDTPADPNKDTRITGGTYGMDVDFSDGSMWYGKTGPWPSGIVKLNIGTNPPETCRTEYYEPAKRTNGDYEAFNVRGMSVDSKGVAYGAFASGRLGRLDRTKCKVLTGPTATGQHCPEGWTYWDAPGPKFQGVKEGNTDFAYLMWVDLFDLLGLGKDIPVVTGSNSDSLLAFDPKTEKWTVLRVPYPMDFHTRGMDGRIDDPNGGWKGKGVYATYAMQPVWHQEGAEDGTSGPQTVKFQIRPNPLAY